MDTQRLILFVVFSFSLLMLWESWQKQGAVSEPAATAMVGAPANVNSNAPVPTLTSAATTLAPNNTANQLPIAAQAVVTTDLVRAVIDANGGDLRSLALLHYQDPLDKNKPLYLFEQSANHTYVAQTGLIGAGLPNHKTLFTLTPGNYQLAPGQDKLVVPLVWEDTQTGLKVTKLYTFHRDSYTIDVTYQLSNPGTTVIPVDAYFQLVRDGKTPEGESKVVHTFTGPALYTEANKFTKIDFHKLDKGEQEYPKFANDGWIAMVQHHFVSVWLPKNGGKREFYAKAIGNGQYSAGVILPEGKVAPGSVLTFDVPMYAGPQIQKTLTALAPGLDYVVDYGWLTPIAAPIFWALQKIHGVVGNWGWAIVILTIMIKLMFFPLSAKSYQSMAQMRGLAPKLQRLKELHGDDRQKLHQSMMDLYKTEKVNPLGGCLPVVVQIPVFIALYWALLGSVEMRQAPFIGWIHDLSVPDPFYILPIIMGLTMILQTRLNPTPPDPIQAKVMMIMPVAFSVFFFFFPAGLVLYWVVNNVLSISQQWVITRKYEAAQAGHAKR
ncbi:membrane protein insertase YidC [Sulfuriferula sp. AH1]|uniref:membrane protein insertase YidC n=1 Tax=Sulfuriferula sp. AH1 TaxID=1985873 RepID=UPI000B3B53C8|nr:membrane protein insertase YidC [Sulfuriferula sp. AH1]ARU32764.1 membrane protein insertase YidC [Sulfuriferula sp. AH1]